MRATVFPGRLSGEIAAIPSKSQAHRLLIAAALSRGESEIGCAEVSEDILRTADCLRALGADIIYQEGVFRFSPRKGEKTAVLDCGESGSTYRFLVPVCAALGGRYTFLLRGRLPQRPMDALLDLLAARGMRFKGRGEESLIMEGQMRGGRFEVPGGISSQFISGLLLAAPLMGERVEIALTSPLRSADYVEITLEALRLFGIRAGWQEGCLAVEKGVYRTPGKLAVEGDWSNAAFWLCAAAAGGSGLAVSGLDLSSTQGDRAILGFLKAFGARVSAGDGPVRVDGGELSGCRVDVDATPDLAPCLALLGAAARGETRLENIARLRIKESDRAAAITQTLAALGADIRQEGDAILIRGRGFLHGGSCGAQGDHRIAMMAACAAAISKSPVSIAGAQAVAKSYPRFFEHLAALGLGVRMEED